MPRQRITVEAIYAFEELSDKAKDKARDWYIDCGFDYEWWDFIYEDAENVGLRLREFDLDGPNLCTGTLVNTAAYSINKIIRAHNTAWATYTIAQEYKRQLGALEAIDNIDERARQEAILEAEYEKDLLAAYLEALREEWEYLHSNKYIDESIVANEHEFFENGQIA